ncbi:CCCH zinc finger protein [Rutstroemia sp. NJR-2017a BVV2]|nr:CCCH zinc finger protein [Rutstroemia sp. NJR-2017a BVV2]PQE18531.1 CCCH zinc finger protein [Rutstroemia sp. NJR-2017a BVV2]
MSSEDQAILEKISQLAGQINKHKNQKPYEQQERTTSPAIANNHGTQHPHHNTRAHGYHPYATSAWRPSRGSYRGSYSPRGYRGGRQPSIVRHRTLILNGNTSTPPSQPDTGNVTPSTDENETLSSAGYITKTDRHLQLINKSYFEKDSQTRAKAIEETRKQRLKQRDDREKLKLSRHLQRLGNGTSSSAIQSNGANNYEVFVNGIRFQVTKNGSKLVKVPGESSSSSHRVVPLFVSFCSLGSGDLNSANATPKTTLIGGVKFHRSKNGNMYRSGIVKATSLSLHELTNNVQGNPRSSKLTNRVNHLLPRVPLLQSQIQLFALCNRGGPSGCQLTTSYLGTCNKGPRCRYIHDASKVGVCKDFLLKGSCPNGDSCDLSHDLTPERTPTCLHFAKGNCSNPDCRYTHVRVSSTALVCRSFGIYGYCEKAATCTERHVHECPDYSNTGTCTTKGCKLPHRLKASVIRKNANAGASAEDSSDISSDEEDEIDSDDVDSDAIDEEFFGHDDEDKDLEMSNQQDYVHFS